MKKLGAVLAVVVFMFVLPVVIPGGLYANNAAPASSAVSAGQPEPAALSTLDPALEPGPALDEDSGFDVSDWILPAIALFLALIGVGLLEKIKVMAKETKELLGVLADALKDGKIDGDELAAILKEFSEAKLALKDLIAGIVSLVAAKKFRGK